MNDSLIHRTIRRSNRNQLIVCLVGALVLVGLAAINTRYFYNFFFGPFPMERETLLATSDAGALQKYFVKVSGDRTLDTGGQEISRNTKSGSERVTAAYMALALDDRFLIVKAQDDTKITDYTGYLEAMPSDVRTEIVADIEGAVPEVRGAFLLFVLNTGSFRSTGYVALALGIPLFGLCLWGLARAIRRSNDPSTHPILRSLSRFGPPDYVASQIDAELLAEHPKAGGVDLTPNWLVHAAPASLSATRIDDVVWAYKQVTQHRTNGVPTGKTYAAQIWDRHGVCITVTGKEPVVNQALEAVAQRSPWVLAGYSPELEKTWKQNRATVVEAVEQRRRQVLGQAQGVPA
ncbi:MAG TPA: DUF6709 family protein [Roseiflexaceae bacterium]|nr:DUF6709 family protein [Roseiflexaceae bacterium]